MKPKDETKEIILALFTTDLMWVNCACGNKIRVLVPKGQTRIITKEPCKCGRFVHVVDDHISIIDRMVE